MQVHNLLRKAIFRFHQVEAKRAFGGRGEMNLNLVGWGSAHLPGKRVLLSDPIMEKEDHSEKEEKDEKRV